MKSHPRARGFTLLEIMIVVAIVAILSSLAMAVIGRVRTRAAESTVRNNLRQIFQAKEFYCAETGTIQPVSIIALARQGYVSASFRDRVLSTHSFEANLGWHYDPVYLVNQPVRAKRGDVHHPLQTITYPGDSADAQSPSPVASADSGSVSGNPVWPPQSAGPGTTNPGTTSPVASTTPAPANTGNPGAGDPPRESGNPSHGPGNSDFGHSHNQDHQGQSHGNPPRNNPPRGNPPHNNPPPKN